MTAGRRAFLDWLRFQTRRLCAGEEAGYHPALWLALKWHRHYRNGHLPRAGGIADQPAFLMDCIDAVEDGVREHEALQAQDMERQEKRSGGAGKPRIEVVGRLDPEHVGDDWRSHLRPTSE